MERNNVEYVLKEISKRYNIITESAEREKEALELLSKHENIIEFFNYFETEDSYSFILEYCPYGTLKEFMKRFETMPIKLVTNYTA